MAKKKYMPTEERLKIRKAYVGKRAWFTVGSIEFAVEIIDMFSKPSRLDFKIIPLWGFGSKWVSYEKLNFNEAIFPDDTGLDRTGDFRRP